MLTLSAEQQQALEQILHWKAAAVAGKTAKLYFTLGGYAGTGKTTLMAYLRRKLEAEKKPVKVAFCSFTGKAARVLQQKLSLHKAVYPKDSVSTIHSLIYSPLADVSGEIVGWERKQKLPFDFIVVDEASMVDKEIWRDLLAYRVPILAVGDHGQLPPIKGEFNLMQQPDVKLEQIHRQAQDNPIIKISIMAREHGQIPEGVYSPGVRKLSSEDSDGQETIQDMFANYNPDTLVLCGYNNTRLRLNNHIRSVLDFGEFLQGSSAPRPGDRVICLRNNHKKQIYNGMLGTLRALTPHGEDLYYAEIDLDQDRATGDATKVLPAASVYKGLIAKEQFNSPTTIKSPADLFDFGYALTVHKAQGSQAKRVVLFEERFGQMDENMWRRWLYTAVTRAEEELYIVPRR